jgi:hypothetical protein
MSSEPLPEEFFVVITLIFVLMAGGMLSIMYWALPSLAVVSRSNLPRLELSPLALAVLGSSSGLVVSTLSVTRIRSRRIRTIGVVDVLLLWAISLLVYLRYGVVPPLNLADVVVTAFFIALLAITISFAIGSVLTYRSFRRSLLHILRRARRFLSSHR